MKFGELGSVFPPQVNLPLTLMGDFNLRWKTRPFSRVWKTEEANKFSQ